MTDASTGRTRRYCSDDCRRRADAHRKKQRHTGRILTCEACGETFTFSTRGTPRRCDTCRAAGIKGPPQACTVCGITYLPRNHGTTTCGSVDCVATLLRAAHTKRKPRVRTLRSDERTRRGRRIRREIGALGLTQVRRGLLLAYWRTQGRRCAYCATGPADTVDHVLPLLRGGTNYEGNLVPACRPCNASKGPRTVMEWRLRRRICRTTGRRVA